MSLGTSWFDSLSKFERVMAEEAFKLGWQEGYRAARNREVGIAFTPAEEAAFVEVIRRRKAEAADQR